MRALIIDSNLLFAKKVMNFLNDNVKDIKVDIAQNVPIMRRRLINNHYDFVIADIQATMDPKSLISELKKVSVPTIVWSVLEKETQPTDTMISDVIRSRVISKPMHEKEFSEALSSLVTFAHT